MRKVGFRNNTKKEKVKIPSPEELNSLLAHYQNGRLEDAEKLAIFITKKFPKHSFSWKVLGAVLKQTGRISEALVANQKALVIDPQDVEVYNNMGNVLVELNRLEKAEVVFRQAIALKPDFAQAYCNLGGTLQKIGKLEEAEASYRQAIVLKPQYPEAYNNLGVTQQEFSKLEEAEASYKQATALKPDYAEAHFNLGNTLQKIGKLEEAEASYKQATALKPDYTEAHFNLGNTLQKIGKLEEAEASYKQATASKPNYAEAHYRLGIIQQGFSKVEEAEASFRQAIVSKPDYAEAFNNLGKILWFNCIKSETQQVLTKLEEAEAIYKQAIALKPDYAEAFNNLADTLKELGRLEEAEASYRQAIALKPDYAEAHSNLGKFIYLNGDIDSALESIEKANHINPKLRTNELLLRVLRARQARENKVVSVNNKNNSDFDIGLTSNPLIVNRPVEAELIANLYEMKSIGLDKMLTPRFGAGRWSSHYLLFEDDRSIIKTVAEDLSNIMRKAVKSDIYIDDSFFNILGAGGGLVPHNHIGLVDKDPGLSLTSQKYSLVYYLTIGNQDSSEPGILKLYDPSEDILPSVGMITIFPANRNHSVIYGGEKDRVVIGVNFYSL